MSRHGLVLAVLAALPLAASAGVGDGRPEWISGESLEWPRHRYVLGVGVADDRATAEERARAEVARVFSARVVATTSSFAAETGRTVAGSTSTVRDVAVSDEVRTSTEKDLVAVEIAAVWQDPATRQTYALAALDRRQAASRITAQLEAFEAQARPLVKAIAGDDRLAAGLAALRYRARAKHRDALVADLQVVSPGARDPAAAAALDAAAAAAVARLTVGVSVKDDPEGVVAAGVTRGLGAAGLTGKGDRPDAASDLVVAVETTLEDLGAREQWYWTRASASVGVRDATGRVLVQLHETERQATTARADGPGRALKALSTRLAARIPAELAAALEAAP
jgi:hypothetical protein